MEILSWLRHSFSDVSSAPAPRFSPLVGSKEPEIDPSVMAEIPSRNYSRSPAPLSATETILNKVKSYADPRKAISLAAELIADPTNFLPQLKGSKIAAGAIGTFFAKNSPFWNPRLATAAEESLRKGARREDIFFDTNTWVNPKDGIWRQELDDSVMIVNPAMINSQLPKGSPAYKMERVIEHNDLFKAAPQLRSTRTFLTTDPTKELGGKFYSGANVIEVNRNNFAEVRSSLIHEIGHGIQRPAGMATGGSPDFLTPEMMPHYDFMKKYFLDNGIDPVTAHNDAAFSAYKHLFGEAEVRASQERLLLKKDQRRQVFPEDSFDINIADAILHRY